jgi:hypothetical protein
MRRNQGLLLSLGCLLALAGACDDGGASAPPGAGSTGSTAGTTSPTAGSTVPNAGSTGGTVTAGSGTGAGGRPAAGTAGSTTTGTAGATTATAGTSGGAAGGDSTQAPGLPAGFRACGKTPGMGSCMASAPGLYAIKTEMDVWWKDENNGNPADGTGYLIDPGRGKLTIFFHTQIKDICEDGSDGVGLLRPCGTRLPAFISDVATSAIQIEFPDALWEAMDIPTYKTGGSTSGFNPGDILTVTATSGLLGLTLAGDPASAVFPTWEQTVTFACDGGMGEMCFPDHDNDGKPGVTTVMRTEGTFDGAPYNSSTGEPFPFQPAPVSSNPLDLLNGTGAKTVYVGLRTRLGGAGAIAADCMSGVGEATAEESAIQSRATACVLNSGEACSDAQIEFVDKNVPNFHILQKGQTPPPAPMWGTHNRPEAAAALDALRMPSVGPLSSMVRLGDLDATATCADVRNANYPVSE